MFIHFIANYNYYKYVNREIESCNQVMSALVLCLENLCLLIGWSEPGMLFSGNDSAA